ncbi:MAG: ATP-binding protein [Synergistaceae bacterium]|nr:ATP-binding protein [Synergistaceae bacterium]
MLFSLIAEATESDFKSELERNKPISWLKSVSAFANGIGGTLFFGVGNDNSIIGLDDAQSDADFISCRIKDRITPHEIYGAARERAEKNSYRDEKTAGI